MQFSHYYILKYNVYWYDNRMTEINLYSVVEFEDGLQVIPNNWLSTDLKKAFWPRYINNKRYDRAVKEMEEPESTWLEYPVQKIFGTFCK